MPTIAEEKEPDKATTTSPMTGGSTVFVADAVGATAQVGVSGKVPTEKWEGGINTLHPLLQPLEDTDIFGNPIDQPTVTKTGGVSVGGSVSVGGGMMMESGHNTLNPNMQVSRPPKVERPPNRRSANFSSSVSVEKMITKIPLEEEVPVSAPNFSFSAMDRMLSQIQENNGNENQPDHSVQIGPPPAEPQISEAAMDRIMSQLGENLGM